MAKAVVTLNLKGINELMTQRRVQAEVLRRARSIQQAAGENFEVASKPHKWTARAFVQAANYKGMVEEARDKRLTRSIDAGR